MELDFSKDIKRSKTLQYIIAEQKARKELIDLPDSAFAHIQEGGSLDQQGRTFPRSLRHFPMHNECQIKESCAALGASNLSSEAKSEAFRKLQSSALELKVEISEDDALGAERYGGKKRSELKDSAFLDPKRRSFPVVSCKDVKDAVSTWGMYKGSMSFETFKSKLKRRAAKLGCESSLPKKWEDESDAKDWEKIDRKELKRDDKKEKKEHYKDAVKDDEGKLEKLKKDKPSEKKSVETHDLKKDIKEDKKNESKAKAKKGKLPPWLKKEDEDDDDEKKADDKDSEKKEESKAQGIAPLNNLDYEKQLVVKTAGDDEKEDEDELKDDDKKEKEEHEKDAIKDDKKQVKDLEKDEKEDRKDLSKDEAMLQKRFAMLKTKW